MNAVALRFYVHETRKHKKVLLFEWLLQRAKDMGIHGGSAFIAIAGYGRHGVIHEQHLFEVAGDVPVMIEFVVDQRDADRLIAMVRDEHLHVFCTRTVTETIDIRGPAP
jgi:uncharacterized protein